MITDRYQFPKITSDMYKEMQEWYKTHNDGKCARSYHGAIGGNVMFQIIPTSIGDFLTVRCACGDTLEYEEL